MYYGFTYAFILTNAYKRIELDDDANGFKKAKDFLLYEKLINQQQYNIIEDFSDLDDTLSSLLRNKKIKQFEFYFD